MDVTVTLDAAEPMELMRGDTPEGIWMRQEPTGRGVTEVSIQGPREDVIDFLMGHWGHSREEAIDYIDYKALDCVVCGLPINGHIEDTQDPRHAQCRPPHRSIFRLFELTMTVYLPLTGDLPITFGDWIERAFGIDQREIGASPTTLNRVVELRYPLAPDVIERREGIKEPIYS